MIPATFVGDILNGTYDDDLDRLVSLVKERKAMIATSVRVGDTIRVTNVSPKYIMGAEVVVTAKSGDRVIVDFPVNPRYRRFSGAKNVTLKAAHVEVVK